jgi:hypothetical protein
MTTDSLRRQYGQSTNLFVSRKDSDHTLVLGGVGEKEQRWVHVMTQRAAQVLWFKLTQLLYPEKAEMVTAMAQTAPLRPFQTTTTNYVDIVKAPEDLYMLVGWIGSSAWRVQLTETETRRLWAALDLALYPVGWEGRVSKNLTRIN